MNTVSLVQFHQVFFEESLEGLDVMEAALLALDQGGDTEMVHRIFRAAHSIKGGAATFGFPEMAAFTHEAESLLDELRDGRRATDPTIVELMLRSVDCLRGMFARAQSGQPLASAESEELRQQLGAMLGHGLIVAPGKQEITLTEVAGWVILFRPHAGMLARGNDPLRLLRELGDLGSMVVEAQLEQLPPLAALDPSQCYLGWRIELHAAVSREAVAAVFEWVEDECDLSIEPIVSAANDAVAEPAVLGVSLAADDKLVALPTSPRSVPKAAAASSPDSGSVRVGIDKIDGLIDLVGELVITQAMLDQFQQDFDPSQLGLLRQGLAQLARHTRTLQENVMGIRMLPIGSVFNRFPRLVRDLSQKLGKQVKLDMLGEHTELDKTVLEKIGDPLVHLVRNAIDHGLEMPEKRRAAGKNETGILRLEAFHRGGFIVVEITDDGAGLNREAILAKALQKGLIASGDNLSDEAVNDLIFQPGFSTAATTTDLSGRGVGMDVVRRNVSDLGGTVSIQSRPGLGATFTITLPLTLAIIDGLAAAVSDERYIVPLVSIIESVQLKAENVRRVAGGGELFSFRGEYLPVVRLHEAFGCVDARQSIETGLVIVVEGDGVRAGLFVDGLIGQQQAVVKSLEVNYRRVQGLSGATILADGSVALIVDVAGLLRMQNGSKVA